MNIFRFRAPKGKIVNMVLFKRCTFGLHDMKLTYPALPTETGGQLKQKIKNDNYSCPNRIKRHDWDFYVEKGYEHLSYIYCIIEIFLFGFLIQFDTCSWICIPGLFFSGTCIGQGLEIITKKRKISIVQAFIWIFPVKLLLFLYVVQSSWWLHQVSLLFIGMKLLVNSLLTGCDSV